MNQGFLQFAITVKSPVFSIRRSLAHIGCFAGGVALGLVVWKSVMPAEGPKGTDGKNSPLKEQRSSDRRRDRQEVSKSGTEILKIIAPYVFAERQSGAGGMTYAKFLRENSSRFLEAADKLPPADDVAAAAIALLEKVQAIRNVPGGSVSKEDQEATGQLNSRLIHWLRKDPVAALRHLSGEGSRYLDTSGAMFAVMSEKGFDEVLGWFNETDRPMFGNATGMFSMFVGSIGEIGKLEQMKAALSPGQWNEAQHQLSYSWPFDKADELFAFALSNHSPMTAIRLARANGKDGADWLMNQINSENLDPAFKESLMNSREFREMMRSNPQIPLETRLEHIGKLEPNKDPEQLALEVGSRDVSGALDDASRDWRFAFKNGKVTFEEVYEAIAADLPELAAGSPDAIRLQVFKELAEENGPAALQALAHTPEPDKWTLALKPTQWMFHGIDPQKFYDYLQHIPHQEPEHYQARFESWVWHSAGNLAAYSRDYVDWVKEMPEGIDREMAAIGILRATARNNDPALRAEVDALVQDPALRARIAEPPPRK
jgi:hypothetical protein